MKVSVLLPTRDRIKLATSSVLSLIEKADDISRVEVLIGIDNDDQVSLDYFIDGDWNNFCNEHNLSSKVFVTERYGYLGLFKYVNHLASQSSEDATHIMFWNDDASVLTKGWDSEIAANENYFGLLRMPCVNMNHPFALMPIITKKWLKLFGTVSMVNHSDWWIYNVCKPLNRVKDINAEIFHDRFDITGNNNDSVAKTNSYALDGKDPSHPDDWSHPDRIRDRQDWTQKLMLYGYPHEP